MAESTLTVIRQGATALITGAASGIGLATAQRCCLHGMNLILIDHNVVDFMVGKMNEGKFYLLCPANEVTEELDRKRIVWTAGDLTEGRPPLTRWRDDWKDRAAREMEKMKL
ncbi:hypothetical protein BDW66DRAFT_155232 [Aspergillus desertorum]